MTDDLDRHFAEQMRDPNFAAAYTEAERRHAAELCRAAATTLRECHQTANGGRWRIELLTPTPAGGWVGPLVGGRLVGEVLAALPGPLAELLDGIAANTEQRRGRPGPLVLDLCRAVLGREQAVH